MKRPAGWKVLTIGAAMTSLGFLSAATARADDPLPSPVDTSNDTIVAPNGGDVVPQEDGRVLGLLCRHLGTC